MSNITLDRPPASAPVTIPITQIDPSPYNPREHYDPDKLQSLANDIRLRGVLQAIIVRPIEGRYEILAGERRFRACMLANEDEIPAVIRECSDLTALEICIAENFQRADLNPIEAARAMQMLSARGLSQAQIGERVGRLQGEVSKAIGLLKLPKPTQDQIATGLLSATHGHYLCGILDKPDEIERLASLAANDRMSTDNLKALVEQARKRIDDVRQPRMDVVPTAPVKADPPARPEPAIPVSEPNLVDSFMGDAPAVEHHDQSIPYSEPEETATNETPPASANAQVTPTPAADVKWTKPETPAAPTPAAASVKAAHGVESAPSSNMVQVVIPQVLDDWLWDNEWTAVSGLELLRRLQDALILRADLSPSIEDLITRIESGEGC